MVRKFVKPENLGAEFDQGNIQADKIRLKLGDGLERLSDGSLVTVSNYVPAKPAPGLYALNVAANGDGSWTPAVETPLYEYRELWAEENGAIANNSAEWSFGNGATGYIGLPFDAGWEVVELGFNADTYPATGTVTIELSSYNTPSNAAGNAIASLSLANSTDGGGATNNAYKHEVLTTPQSVPVGLVGFLTRTVTGTCLLYTSPSPRD